MHTVETALSLLPEGQRHHRSGTVIVLPVDREGLPVLVRHLYRAQRLPLKTMTAVDDGSLRLIYVFGIPGSEFSLAVSHELDGEEFPSMASEIPELSGYERYAYSFFGLRPIGHTGLQRGWLHGNWPEGVYPLRKGFSWNERPDTASVPYEFKVIDGEGMYEVSVGPVHAGIIEPGHFRFSQAGEEIINLEATLGYVHKGVEKLFERFSLEKSVSLSERVSGDSSFAHSTAFCEAVEKLAGLEVPRRGRQLRVVLLELERIANHLNDIAFIMNDTAYSFGGSQGTRLRESVLRWHEKLTGGRFMRRMNRIGGLAKDIDDDLLTGLQEFLADLETQFTTVTAIAEESTSMINRLEGTGVLRQATARDLGAVGIAARACGIARDSRAEYPHPVYSDLKLQPAVFETGDVRARYDVRVTEVHSSIDLIRQVCASLSDGPVATEEPCVIPADSLAISQVEGWRGEIVYLLVSDKDGALTRVQVRDPSFLNWPLATFAARANVILDFPLINKSFNLSYSGNDL